MRAVIQRSKSCSITINHKEIRPVDDGFFVLLGIEEEDTEDDAEWLAQKVINMRVFSDEEGKMNLSLAQVEGGILIVSQFTLFASTKKGNRPSFIRSAKPDRAIPLYDFFVAACKKQYEFADKIKTGEFGADMKIQFVNDGPVTIIIDSKNKE